MLRITTVSSRSQHQRRAIDAAELEVGLIDRQQSAELGKLLARRRPAPVGLWGLHTYRSLAPSGSSAMVPPASRTAMS